MTLLEVLSLPFKEQTFLDRRAHNLVRIPATLFWHTARFKKIAQNLWSVKQNLYGLLKHSCDRRRILIAYRNVSSIRI